MNHKTGFLFHELYMWHDTGSAALWYPAGLRVQPAQSAESKRRLRNLMEVAGILDDLSPVRPRAATREELLRVHTPEYVDTIVALSAERGGDAGEGTPFGHGSYEIACLAAGGHRLYPHQDEVIVRAAVLAERVPAG